MRAGFFSAFWFLLYDTELNTALILLGNSKIGVT